VRGLWVQQSKHIWIWVPKRVEPYLTAFWFRCTCGYSDPKGFSLVMHLLLSNQAPAAVSIVYRCAAHIHIVPFVEMRSPFTNMTLTSG